MYKYLIVICLCISSLFLTSNVQAEEVHHDNWNAGLIAGVGLPSLVSFQGVVKVKDIFSINPEFGFTPKFSVSELSAHQEMYDLGLRLYPFRGDFFVGVGAGIQNASIRDNGLNEYMTVKTTFIDPRLGMLHSWSCGISLGFDIAVEIPIGGSVELSNNASSINEVVDIGNKIKTTPVPVIHALQFGYLF